MNIQYSILKYLPDIFSDECIYVGVIFHNLDTNEREFITQANKRFFDFDDSLHIKQTKIFLEGLKAKWLCPTLFSTTEFPTIESLTRFFVNEFVFSEIIEIQIDTPFHHFCKKLSKGILHHGVPKSQRLTDDERLAIISESIPQHFDIRRNFSRSGNYDRQNFDYYIHGIAFEQEIGIKIIKKNTPFTTLQSLRMFMIDNPHLKATILFDNQDVVEADTYLYIKDVIDKLDNVKITDNPREVMW